MIRGILFDSGDTLVRPVDGEWFPGAAFRRALAERNFDDPSGKMLEQTLDKGMAYLDAHHCLDTEEEEGRQFEEYYRILFRCLGIDGVGAEMLRRLSAGPVKGMDMAPFPDTVPTLERLRRDGLTLGIVSNAWPSLNRKYVELGLRDYFDVFVVSAQVGCFKPDRRIFDRAINDSGLPPPRTSICG